MSNKIVLIENEILEKWYNIQVDMRYHFVQSLWTWAF